MTTAVPIVPGCLVCNSPIGAGRLSRTLYCTPACKQQANSRRKRARPISDPILDRAAASENAARRRVAESEALRLDTANRQLRKDLAEARRNVAAQIVKGEQWAETAAKRKRQLEEKLADAFWRERQLGYELRDIEKVAAALRAQVPVVKVAPTTPVLWRATGLTTQRIFELWLLAGRDMCTRRQHTAAPDIYEWESEMMHAWRVNERHEAARRKKIHEANLLKKEATN